MTVGERIKAARIKAGFTQGQLAKSCGVVIGTIQQYEYDKRQPRIEQLESIADVLGITLFDLLSDSPVTDSPDSPFKSRLDTAFYKLNDKGQRVAAERVEELTQIPEYKQHPTAANTEDTAEPEQSGE